MPVSINIDDSENDNLESQVVHFQLKNEGYKVWNKLIDNIQWPEADDRIHHLNMIGTIENTHKIKNIEIDFACIVCCVPKKYKRKVYRAWNKYNCLKWIKIFLIIIAISAVIICRKFIKESMKTVLSHIRS